MSDLGTNRYSERYKSFLVDSPPRNDTPITSILRNSPLQPVRTGEHKIYEGEKYSSYEIKNEDNGEWRQLNSTSEAEVKKVEVNSPKQYVQETQTITHQYKEKIREETEESPIEPQVEVKQEEQTEGRRVKKIPHYMMATTSFQKKTHPSNRDEVNLGLRTKGGITVSRIFKVTTLNLQTKSIEKSWYIQST